MYTVGGEKEIHRKKQGVIDAMYTAGGEKEIYRKNGGLSMQKR